jgi:hypothetical protein
MIYIYIYTNPPFTIIQTRIIYYLSRSSPNLDGHVSLHIVDGRKNQDDN